MKMLIDFLRSLFAAFPGPARQPALGIMGGYSPALGQTQAYALFTALQIFTGDWVKRPP